ncbi:A disintegrin and metalloproteinase with thrombospondin motifs 5-like [Aplysia californica]|uniref:A disintegrin and metalloproteinase with thrombospondin motifs 5-like n=1 Tax=Aplysia californica TaxID=6500 RepID=A0ABM1VTY8_APLCA|nr:A disintegrin and metalloproteinase with thrombospondin motifs 5-like [Aplysia californica]
MSSDSGPASDRYAFPGKLPGQVFPLEDQCRHYIGGVPCSNVPLEKQCGRLCCEKWSQPFPSKEPAADGTYCGGGRVCYNGGCIPQTQIPV